MTAFGKICPTDNIPDTLQRQQGWMIVTQKKYLAATQWHVSQNTFGKVMVGHCSKSGRSKMQH